jgi:hypothetical protein
MQYSRIQIGIAIGACLLLLIGFFGYLLWLNNQGPVLSKSEDRDPLSGTPNSISLNPLRDRTSERIASEFIRAMRDGKWSESAHPLISWQIVDWEDTPPLRILHYTGKRYNAPGQKGTYKELFSVTLDNRTGEWIVTKYDAMY